MIFDNIKNRVYYEKFNSSFEKAFDFIEKAQKEELPVGRYELDGDKLYAVIQEYETRDDWNLFEAHRRYTDLQFIVSGREYMECADLSDCNIHTPYDGEKEAGFYTACGFKRGIEMGEGDFVVFFPHDAHRPSISLGEKCKVKKIVVKVEDAGDATYFSFEKEK